eukprot:4122519-Prymnesium_polylepis.1
MAVVGSLASIMMKSSRRIKNSDCQATARRAGASERHSLDRGRRAASTEAHRSAEPAITMARILETS